MSLLQPKIKRVSGYGNLDVENPDPQRYMQWACLLHAIVKRDKIPTGDFLTYSAFSHWLDSVDYRPSHTRLVDLSPLLEPGNCLGTEHYVCLPVDEAYQVRITVKQSKAGLPRWVRRSNSHRTAYAFTITQYLKTGNRVIRGTRNTPLEAHNEALRVFIGNLKRIYQGNSNSLNRAVLERSIEVLESRYKSNLTLIENKVFFI